MKKLLFSAALLVFAANVWAEPVVEYLPDENELFQMSKRHATELPTEPVVDQEFSIKIMEKGEKEDVLWGYATVYKADLKKGETVIFDVKVSEGDKYVFVWGEDGIEKYLSRDKRIFLATKEGDYYFNVNSYVNSYVNSDDALTFSMTATKSQVNIGPEKTDDQCSDLQAMQKFAQEIKAPATVEADYFSPSAVLYGESYCLVYKMNVPKDENLTVTWSELGVDNAIYYIENGESCSKLNGPIEENGGYVYVIFKKSYRSMQITNHQGFVSFEMRKKVTLSASEVFPDAKPGEIVTLDMDKITPEGFVPEDDTFSVMLGGEEMCQLSGNRFVLPAGDVKITAWFKSEVKNDDSDEEKPENPDSGNEGETGGNQNPTDVNEVNVSAQSVVGEKYHTVLGQPLSEPQTSGVTVVTRTYSDGAVRSSKEVR